MQSPRGAGWPQVASSRNGHCEPLDGVVRSGIVSHWPDFVVSWQSGDIGGFVGGQASARTSSLQSEAGSGRRRSSDYSHGSVCALGTCSVALLFHFYFVRCFVFFVCVCVALFCFFLFFSCILDLGVRVKNIQDCCIGTHVAV